ncbi:DUF4150 domain-containing protein [Thalassotalea euphylliae]|uniref:DUF4150 domain-containing protein n=1 Tax=Thalassotalea euphylliae TaxID=1655234 RepID=A0A3E0TTL1_9GAMM|nr:DUF4150 domain-containing protein [Thalassotalea euphylliae]REL27770.1 DUF4150 domain-containing protein [Thalassotalea euphylliae]
MTNYINAHLGSDPQSIQYDIDQLTAEVRSGGNQAWRHNNVALLPFNISSRQAGGIGMANGVAIFPDKESSQQAFLNECQRPKYVGDTLGQMINRFIPEHIVEPPQWDEEKSEPILPWLEPVTGLDMNAKLTNYEALLTLVEEHIGWQMGSVENIEKDQQSQAPNVSTVTGNNVLINGKTAVHQDSGGALQTVDVCLTTIGKSVIPIAYPNLAQSSDAASTASSVKINGNPACHIKSNFSKSTGDQPGDKKGVASGTTEGKAEFITSSLDVFIEGKPAVRQGDLMVSNNKNTPPAPLMQPGGPLPQGLEIAPKDPIKDKNKPNQIAIKASGDEKLDDDSMLIG